MKGLGPAREAVGMRGLGKAGEAAGMRGLSTAEEQHRFCSRDTTTFVALPFPGEKVQKGTATPKFLPHSMGT